MGPYKPAFTFVYVVPSQRWLGTKSSLRRTSLSCGCNTKLTLSTSGHGGRRRWIGCLTLIVEDWTGWSSTHSGIFGKREIGEFSTTQPNYTSGGCKNQGRHRAKEESFRLCLDATPPRGVCAFLQLCFFLLFGVPPLICLYINSLSLSLNWKAQFLSLH